MDGNADDEIYGNLRPDTPLPAVPDYINGRIGNYCIDGGGNWKDRIIGDLGNDTCTSINTKPDVPRLVNLIDCEIIQ